MGNPLPVQHPQPYQEYTIVSQLKQIHLGHIKLLQDRQSQIFLQKTFSFITKQKSQAFLRALENRNQKQHPHLVQIRNIREQSTSKMITRVSVIMKIHQRTLGDYFRQSKNICQENQIWMIAQQILQVLLFFQEQECYHGDLNMATVFLDKDGLVKIHDPLVCDRSSTSQIAALARTNKSFIAPEIYFLALQDNFHLGQMDVRTDVFSLGMILFSMATGQIGYQYFSNGLADLNKINLRIDSLNVSQQLQKLLKSSLKLVQERLKPSQLMQLVKEKKRKSIQLLPLSNSYGGEQSFFSSRSLIKSQQSLLESICKFSQDQFSIKSVSQSSPSKFQPRSRPKGQIPIRLRIGQKENDSKQMNQPQSHILVAPKQKQEQKAVKNRRMEQLQEKIKEAIKKSNQTMSRHMVNLR